MSSKGKVASVRVKDVNIFELTPRLADALSASLDARIWNTLLPIVQG
jgi:hypothetical protein